MGNNNFGNSSALRDELTPRLLFIAIFSCMGAFTFGFDNAWWGAILGQTYFNSYYGSYTVTDASTGVTSTTVSASQQSAGTALGTAAIALGCMSTGYLADSRGRKFCFYAVSFGSLIGVIVEATSGINGGRIWQLIVGKMVVCFSIGIASVAVPLYLAEISPAPIRGALVNSYVWVQSFGGLVAYGVVYAVLNFADNRVWLYPICLQLLAPLTTVLCAWSLPESPRWLVEKGRTEDARAALISVRKGKAGYNPDSDLTDLVAAYELSLSKSKGTWAQCFKGKDALRTNLVLGIQCLQQGQGISFMSTYLVVFFLQLGIQNVYEILLIIYGVIILLSAGGFFVQDYFGRRWLLMVGGTIMCAGLGSVAIVTTVIPSPVGSAANACVGLIVVWLVGFCLSWTSIPWTISAEVPREELRDKTVAIGACGGYVTGMIVGLVNPYMQDAEYGNLGGKVGFVYGFISVVAVIWVYFMIPELKGRSLEEVDYMFAQGISIRKMGRYVVDSAFLSVPVEGQSHEIHKLGHKQEVSHSEIMDNKLDDPQ